MENNNIFFDLYSRQKILDLMEPLHAFKFARRNNEGFENIDSVCICLNILAWVVQGENPSVRTGRSRTEMEGFAKKLVSRMDAKLSPELSENIARDILNSLINEDEAFSVRCFDGKSGSMMSFSFRFLEKFFDENGRIRYHPTNETYVVLSRIQEITEDDRLKIIVEILRMSMNSGNIKNAVETADEFLDNLRRVYADMRIKLKQACRHVSEKAYESILEPMFKEIDRFAENSKKQIASLRNNLMASDNSMLASALEDRLEQILCFFVEMHNFQDKALDEYFRSCERYGILRDIKIPDFGEMIKKIMNCEVSCIQKCCASFVSSLYPPVFPDNSFDLRQIFNVLAPKLKEKEEKKKKNGEEIMEFFQQYKRLYSLDEIRKMKQKIMVDLTRGETSLQEILDSFENDGMSYRDLRLAAMLCYRLFAMDGKETGFLVEMKGTFAKADLHGDGLVFKPWRNYGSN